MKKLIKIIKEIENTLIDLETLLKQEYKNLLNVHSDISDLKKIIKKKQILFSNFPILTKDRLFLEKKYNISQPYKNHDELKKCWINIVSKSLFLKKINSKNKIILNKKIYLNQNFLELFSTYKKHITYDVNGNLKI